MSFWSDFGKGVSSHIKAIEFVFKHGLWIWFLYPMCLLVLLALFGFYSIYNLSDWLVDHFLAELIPEINTGAGWLNSAIEGILWVVKFAAGFVIHLYVMNYVVKILKYIVLIFCSPVMAFLSEKVEEIKTGNKFPFVLSRFLRDILRSLGINLRNLLVESLIILACLIIGWIPVIGWITIPFLWIISWYFMGFNMMDYTYERKRFRISEGVRFTRKRKGIAVGNGMIFSGLIIVPYIGLILAPILSPVAATLATLEAMNEKK